jgi:hypothetical protein
MEEHSQSKAKGMTMLNTTSISPLSQEEVPIILLPKPLNFMLVAVIGLTLQKML